MIGKEIWTELSNRAWEARSMAHIYGNTKVGCAVYYDQKQYAIGCNVEHVFRCHDFHAETNAIGNMVVQGGKAINAILVVAEREKFTPCGSCMDWIFQFGGDDTIVAFQSSPNGEIQQFNIWELMPHYPK